MTSLAIVAFKEANAGGKYDKVIDAATKYVKSLQYGEGLDPKDAKYGGAGYDKPNARAGRTCRTRSSWSSAARRRRVQGRPGHQEGARCSSAAART